jgi:hypothetical protein
MNGMMGGYDEMMGDWARPRMVVIVVGKLDGMVGSWVLVGCSAL